MEAIPREQPISGNTFNSKTIFPKTHNRCTGTYTYTDIERAKTLLHKLRGRSSCLQLVMRHTYDITNELAKGVSPAEPSRVES